MKYKAWMRLIRRHPHKDLNGKYVAYDIDGAALGEVVYKAGKVVSKREYAVAETNKQKIKS